MRDDGISNARFSVDKAGRIAWAKKYNIPDSPDVEELFEKLGELR